MKQHRSRALILFTGFLLAVTLSACGSNKIDFLRKDSAVKIDNVQKFDRDGLLVVQFQLVNTSDKPKEGRYRLNWYYSSGMALDAESWKPVTLSPKQRLDLRATAPSMRAADYRAEIDFPN
jgi:uncharacterized protein YcfL